MVSLLAYTIRLASLAYGGFVIMASMPLALLAGAAPSDIVGTPSALYVMRVAACLIASGFVYVGLSGRRMAKSRLHYVLVGVLLAAPMILGAWLLTPSSGYEWRPVGLFFLVPASLLFSCAVWPLHVTSKRAEV
jgi:hypothetical protein